MSRVSKLLYILLFVFAGTIFLLHYLVTGQAVYGDGVGYYAHLHSWYFDHDFNYTNEYKHVYTPENNNNPKPLVSPVIQIVGITQDGRAENLYSTGVAILLFPFYAVADGIAIIGNGVGIPFARNGYSDVYQITVGLGAVIYTVLGIYLLEKMAVFYTKDVYSSRLAAFTIFCSSQLLYYGSFDVINSHFASFFLTSFFFYLMLTKKINHKNSLVLGLIGGLVVSSRIQDGVVLAIGGGLFIFNMWKDRLSIGMVIKKHHENILLFILGFCVSISPLIYHWHQTFGNILQHRYILDILKDRQTHVPIQILGSFFHPQGGLFSVSPLLFIVFLFLVLLFLRRKVAFLVPFFLFFSIQFLIITIQGGYVAASFGGRMYISSLPLFGIGLAILLQRIQKRFSLKTAVFVCFFFVILNLLNMGYFIVYQKGAEGGRAGTETRTIERVQRMLQPLRIKWDMVGGFTSID